MRRACRLIVYERGRVTDDDPSGLNIRVGPGTVNYGVIGMIPTNGVFFVLEGPRCTQRYTWYRVRYGELEGWVAEGTIDRCFAEPYLPG